MRFAHRSDWFACLAAFMALNPPGDIVGITIFSGSLYAVFFPPVVFGLYGRVAPASRVFVAMLFGIATLIAWIALGLSSLLHGIPGSGRIYRYLPSVFRACGRSASG